MYKIIEDNVPLDELKNAKQTWRTLFYRKELDKNWKIECNMCWEKASFMRLECTLNPKKWVIEWNHYNLYTKKWDMFSLKRDLNKCFCWACFYRMTRWRNNN